MVVVPLLYWELRRRDAKEARMKLLLIMYSGHRPDARARACSSTQGVHGYTELEGAHGAGSSGRREGTRAWPGETAGVLLDGGRRDAWRP